MRFQAVVFYVALTIGIAAPLPPRVSLPAADRAATNFHLKEDSPFNCSRAVSRWVRQAWSIVANDALKRQPTDALLGPTCPMRQHSLDMYYSQEGWKSFKGLHNGYVCRLCNKVFKTEYHIDRHIDRRHSNVQYNLLDSYRGGVPTEAYDRGLETIAKLNETANPFVRWGECLEDHCAIFDVCDRPPNRSTIVLKNNLSMTPSNSSESIGEGSSRDSLQDGLCNSLRLFSAWRDCQEIVDRCFPIDSDHKFVRAANIHTKLHLCGALQSCEHYITRRQYAGSRGHYTEGAYTGTLFKPISSMSGWQIALVITATVTLLFAAIAAFCCVIETQDAQHTRKRPIDAATYAYRSGLDQSSPIVARRRGGVENLTHKASSSADWQQGGAPSSDAYAPVIPTPYQTGAYGPIKPTQQTGMQMPHYSSSSQSRNAYMNRQLPPREMHMSDAPMSIQQHQAPYEVSQDNYHGVPAMSAKQKPPDSSYDIKHGHQY